MWFRTFLDDCSTLRPNPALTLRPAPARQGYAVIATYVNVVIQRQTPDDIRDTIEFLVQLFGDDVDYVQERPFTLITALFYLDSLVARRWPSDRLLPLRQLICSMCAIPVDRISDDRWTAALVDEAVEYIYKRNTNNHLAVQDE